MTQACLLMSQLFRRPGTVNRDQPMAARCRGGRVTKLPVGYWKEWREYVRISIKFQFFPGDAIPLFCDDVICTKIFGAMQ